MPTVEDLLKRTEYLVDDVMDADLAINLFNEALEEIDTVYGEAKRQTTTLVAGSNTVIIPSDALEIIRVILRIDGKGYPLRVSSDVDIDSTEVINEYVYTRFGDEMSVFPIQNKPSDVVIEYYGGSEKIPSVSTDPSLAYMPKIPERYHRALPLYAAAKYFENWEDNPEQRSNFQKKYDKIVSEIAYTFERKVRGSKSSKVYIERGWS